MERYTGDWYRLYRGRWGDDIVPDAYAHPAKFARGLIRRIYDHLIERGYVRPGDRVADPFGGVALGALDAMRLGLDWWGNELEEKFVKLGLQNLALWDRKYKPLWPDTWGSASLTQGDSRELGRVLRRRRESLEALGAVVSSPPYAAGCAHTGGDDPKPEHVKGGELRFVEYGDTEGQLGTMKEGDHDAVVSSPPYSRRTVHGQAGIDMEKLRGNTTGLGSQIYTQDRYGTSPGQLGTSATGDFWTAARQIVDQCYLILKPGAVAVWVVKRFVRNKQIVDFPDQWRQMCEAAGFETVEWIRAWVVEEHGEQLDLFGNSHARKVERKSFFRRLYESKYPENSIDYEDVLIMRRLT